MSFVDQVEVRSYLFATDAKDVSAIVAEAHDGGELWALSWSETVFRDELDRAVIWVAIKGAKVCGFLCARPPGPSWEITIVAVAASLRGHGISELLIQALANHIGIQGDASSREITLEVRADNAPAQRAYEKSRFKAVGRRKAYYRDGEDAILYKRLV